MEETYTMPTILQPKNQNNVETWLRILIDNLKGNSFRQIDSSSIAAKYYFAK